MDHGAVPAVGSDVVSEESSAFASCEQLDLQSDIQDMLQNNCMETEECRSVKEHSETVSNDAGVDIRRNEQSVVSDFLPQPNSAATVASCESICDVLKNNDPHLAECEIDGEKPQNHSSQDALVSVLSYESVDGCSYGKRVSDSAESCEEPASKRLKASHDSEASDPMTTEVQTDHTSEAVAGNLDVLVNIAEVANADQSERVAEVYCPVKEPSVVEINPPVNSIPADDLNNPMEPLSSTIETNPPTNNIEDDDFTKPQELLSSAVENNPPTNIIQDDDFSKPRERLSSVVEINPSTIDFHIGDSNTPQKLSIIVDSAEGNAECTQQMMTSDDAFSQPKQDCVKTLQRIENPNVSPNVPYKSSVVQASSVPNKMTVSEGSLTQPEQERTESLQRVENPDVPCAAIQTLTTPSVETLIASQTTDQTIETASTSVALVAGDTSESRDPPRDPPPPPLGVGSVESFVSDEKPGTSRSDVAGGETCLSPFEISLVIDNLIRRELEASESSRGSEEEEDMSDDSGDEDLPSDEKMDVDDEEVLSRFDSESSLKAKDEDESSGSRKDDANESADQSQVPCELLLQEKDEVAKTTAECRSSGESAADESKSGLNLTQVGLNIGSDRDKISSEHKEEESVKELDAERGKIEATIKKLDVECEKTEGAIEKLDIEREKTDDIARKLVTECEKTESTVKKPDDECGIPEDSVKERGKIEATIKKLDVECEKTESAIEKLDIEREKTDDIVRKLVTECEKTEGTVKKPDVECGKTENSVQGLEVEYEQPKLVHSNQEVSSEANPVQGSDLVGPVDSVSGDLISEVGGILTQEGSIKEALPQNTDEGGIPKSSELLAGGDTVHSGAMTVATPECVAEALIASASDVVATEEVARKLYDPFEDMDVVDEDAATDEDGLTSADDTNDKTKTVSEKGTKKAKGQGSKPNQVQYGPEREDPTQWTKDNQWSGNDQAQWSAADQASWYNQSNDGQTYSESRMPGAAQPPLLPEPNYGPSNYDPSNMQPYGMPPPNTMPPPHASWPAPPGYMQPYPGTMPPPMGYGMPMPYGGMAMPQYFGQWGQWPAAGPAYPMVQQQQQQQQQQDWQNWWQSYSAWYSNYMTGWTQPTANPPPPIDYQSQGSWSTANQQYAPPPPTSKAPPLPPAPVLPAPKQSPKIVSSATKTDVASSNAKVSYRPTVAKGPILNSSTVAAAPSSAPKLRFAISGPVPSATPKPAPPAAPKPALPPILKPARPTETLPARKDVVAGSKTDQETGNSIWVGNLPLGTSAVDVRTLISKHGKVVKCKVGSMKTQKDAGLSALVTMETADDVGVCVQMLHESHYNGQRILVRKLKQQ